MVRREYHALLWIVNNPGCLQDCLLFTIYEVNRELENE